MKRLSEINESLPDLMFGILIFGIAAELLPIWFVEDKTGYSIGLFIGVISALFSAWHMAYILGRAIDYDEAAATKQMQKGTALRYGIQLILIGILGVTGIGSPIAAFIGMFTLKVSAYAAPFTHKILRR